MTNLLFRNRYLESAVNICIVNINEKQYIILEKRAKGIRQEGEISFPGGKKDDKDENFMQTAIRETCEELGIEKNKIKNTRYFGTLVSATAVILEVYISELSISDFSELNFNKAEVEKLLFVPIDYFFETKAKEIKIKCYNKSTIDLKNFNIPEKYQKDWELPDRKIFIFEFDGEAIWGMTSEVILEFINFLNKMKVRKYDKEIKF